MEGLKLLRKIQIKRAPVEGKKPSAGERQLQNLSVPRG